jgi:hypothetical protein
VSFWEKVVYIVQDESHEDIWLKDSNSCLHKEDKLAQYHGKDRDEEEEAASNHNLEDKREEDMNKGMTCHDICKESNRKTKETREITDQFNHNEERGDHEWSSWREEKSSVSFKETEESDNIDAYKDHEGWGKGETDMTCHSETIGEEAKEVTNEEEGC